MPKRNPLLRTSITIPADVLAQADRLAKAWDRSRSWVLAEAVRRLAQPPGTPAAAPAVREPIAAPYPVRRPGLGRSRLRQLEADMAMSIDDRVLAAEETNRIDRELHPPCRGLRLTFFDRFEDYLDWKRTEGLVR